MGKSKLSIFFGVVSTIYMYIILRYGPVVNYKFDQWPFKMSQLANMSVLIPVIIIIFMLFMVR